MKEIKPPVPVKVVDLTNLARLAIALTDGHQILWKICIGKKKFLALLTAYLYWEGDIPLMAYTEYNVEDSSFLAYKSDSYKGEEIFFTQDIEDTKFKYASVIDLNQPPKPFLRSIKGDYPPPPSPMLVKTKNINSILRLLVPLSIKEGLSLPLWHFKSKGKNIIGVCVPFEHYYEADALPMLLYCDFNEPPKKPFIKYRAVKGKGEEIEFTENTSESKYFYVKIVSVESLPLFPLT